MPAEVLPEWKARIAAIERWSREVWIAKHRKPGEAPADPLLEGELSWAWEAAIRSTKDPKGGALVSPAPEAVVEAAKSFHMVWEGPETLRCGTTGQEFLLTEGSPAMLQKLYKLRWSCCMGGLRCWCGWGGERR